MIRRVRSSRCGQAARNFRFNNSDGVLTSVEHTVEFVNCHLYLLTMPKFDAG